MSGKRALRSSRVQVLLCVLIVLLVIAICGILLFRKMFDQPDIPAVNPSGNLQQGEISDPVKPERTNIRRQDFYTVLISGVDDGNGGADTNILVAFDAADGDIHCVSIPRDSAFYVNGTNKKINYAYNKGGVKLLADSLSEGLGIPVDYTVEVDLQGFVQLVDAIGGVDFNVPLDMNYDDPYQDLSIHISKGPQTLNGQDALGVVRFRHNNDGTGYGNEDLGRIGTQQAFLKAVARQMLQLENIDKVSEFVRIFNKHVKTDLSLGNLAWLGKEALSMGLDKITFSTLPGQWDGAQSRYILDQAAVLELINASLNPYVEDRIAEDLHLVG